MVLHSQVLETCLHLHIRCVTVYAFSIENFKRSEAEVDALMDLAKRKLEELCQQGYVMRLSPYLRIEV